jgi:putative solute:sodium symporter small subunit
VKLISRDSVLGRAFRDISIALASPLLKCRLLKAVWEETMSKNNTEAHWEKTSKLMITMLVLWAFFGYVVHMFVVPLNGIKILGFPLGFYMASQGSLIAFVVMLFWFAKAQNDIDHEFGMAEDE